MQQAKSIVGSVEGMKKSTSLFVVVVVVLVRYAVSSFLWRSLLLLLL